MSKKSLIAGLDIGSNKVCCAAGIRDEDTRIVKILGAVCVPCDGIKAGAVINIQETALAIGKTFEETEKVVGAQIGSVITAMRGSFIKSKDSKGVANISYSNREISQETVDNALESAKKQIRLEPDQEIIQIIPREYILNQQRGIQNPIGMEGTYIEVDVHAFVASSSNIGNIAKSMSSIGVNCDDRVYGYLSASDILVTREEKELSCLVVDFGGLTTGLVHYLDGIIRHTDELPDGSDYITRDIGHKLRATYSISRDIKEKYGAAFVYTDFKNEEFEYKSADGRSIKKCDKLELANGIITPRIDRILYEVKEIINKNNYGDEFLSGGIILTGGGSNLAGLTEAFEKAFNCSVRTGVPNSEKVIGPNEILMNPSYTTAIGAIVSSFSNIKYFKRKSSGNGMVSKISKWFEEIF
ncbi:MAG: cell division protein FtsA [Endomicrobium sp.]|jgi:cell division protein FtsA|uniref:cell division protein FtsA n=1 Tax=Candidatus Endomicrobiellum cubanum TaxID=3242325 RepID=UPI00281EA361|nr:cell division protein FtsA [Endomicrobium sp.]